MWPFSKKETVKPSAAKQKPVKKHCCNDDPIERAFDKWDNDPGKLTLEDMLWLDEVLGDE